MKLRRIHILMLMGCLLVMQLLQSCIDQRDEDDCNRPWPMLSIYVYAPDQAVLTRADDGLQVAAFSEENRITKLQIWVYKHDDEEGNSLGYLSLDGAENFDNLNTLHSEVYRMELKDNKFADMDASARPTVDVYVLANVTYANCGATYGDIPSYGLDNAVIYSNKFNGIHEIPSDGLPMSAVLLDQKVDGVNNVLHISEAQLTLVRTVSKIRFVFSAKTGSAVYVDSVVLDADMVPRTEYLFLDEADTHVGTDYVKSRIKLLERPQGTTIATNDAPTDYKYSTTDFASLAAYASKVQEGINAGKLTADSVYLRETNKQLSGNIYYRVGSDATVRKATFQMANSSFPRNHTWIVYAHYSADGLDVGTVDVDPWNDDHDDDDGGIYNW